MCVWRTVRWPQLQAAPLGVSNDEAGLPPFLFLLFIKSHSEGFRAGIVFFHTRINSLCVLFITSHTHVCTKPVFATLVSALL